jgi:hypothetical protein
VQLGREVVKAGFFIVESDVSIFIKLPCLFVSYVSRKFALLNRHDKATVIGQHRADQEHQCHKVKSTVASAHCVHIPVKSRGLINCGQWFSG